MRSAPSLILLLAVAALCGACADESDDPVARGERVYRANCTACHNMDPKLDGVLGPAVAGSSPALVEARVMRAGYPEGYTPKRDTALMQPLPYLKDEVPAIAAYLAAASR